MLQMDADMKLSLHHASSPNPLPSAYVVDEGVDIRQDSRGEKTEDLSPSPATPTLKDTGKKKRLNRAAKLRQCKLDARRGQFLAQVAGKLNRSESGSSSQDNIAATESRFTPTANNVGVEDGGSPLGGSNGRLEEPRLKARQLSWDTLNVALEGKKTEKGDGVPNDVSLSLQRDLGVQQFPTSEGRKQDLSRPPQSPGSSNLRHEESRGHLNEVQGNSRDEASVARIHMRGFSTWSSSEASTSRSNSSRGSSRCGESGSDEDDSSEVDDWEAAADALHVQPTFEGAEANKRENRSPDKREPLQNKAAGIASSDIESCVLKPESKYRSGTFGGRMRADIGRAWRPDDVSRPPTLPRLSKQHSFPVQSSTSVWGALHGNIWGPPPAPSHCPICTEELDTTDSSFMPCSCGFRLCLFCHHKIVLGDGRCPGCRKSYNSEVALKLSRTCSVRPRS